MGLLRLLHLLLLSSLVVALPLPQLVSSIGGMVGGTTQTIGTITGSSDGSTGSSSSSSHSGSSGGSRQRKSGRYMVVFKENVTPPSQDIVTSIIGNSNGLINIVSDQVYQVGQFKGFAGSLSTDQRQSLSNDPRVAYIEEDGWATTQQQGWVTQNSVPWGLARISHRVTGNTNYVYDNTGGTGTCVYTIDTGVDVTNPEFEGRATFVKSFVGPAVDNHGHGSHVAGIIASKSFGVAKKSKIYAIKVLDASGGGYWSDIVSGVNYAVNDAKARSCPKGVVLNMSLGGGHSQAVNAAVAAAVDAGIFVSVAAGNDGTDFSKSSPASEPKAFSVGASDTNDKIASWSNYGRTLGITAPGVDIMSIWNDRTTNTLSGTSMATPHISGMAACFLSMFGPSSPGSIGARLKGYSTKNALGISAAGQAATPNMLAYNGAPA